MRYQDVLIKAREVVASREGKLITPFDLLAGMPEFSQDSGEFRRMLSQIQRDLKEDGKNHDMLGTVFALSEHTRGRLATGYGENPPFAPNEHGPMEFLSSKVLAPISEFTPEYRLPQSVQERAAMTQVVATASVGVQEKVLAFVQSQDAELRVLQAESEGNRRLAEEASKNAQFMRDLVTRLTSSADGPVAIGSALEVLSPARH